jgi:cytochrome c5
MRSQSGSVHALALLPALVLFAVAAAAVGDAAAAPRKERQGKEVVDAVCGECHASGRDGAPRIGDAAAWSSRASQGLTALTGHALKGIRKMPAHGGSKGVSDIEIQRAIVYMVNSSGGNWVDPRVAAAPGVARTSEVIVQAQCAKCHQTGQDGAPRIGDRPAWMPRMAKGLDELVASAVNGHGPMPSRGGLPDLSRQEIRDAVLYMFNYGVPAATPPAPVAAADPHHKLVSGIDVYFGMMRAEAMRSAQAQGDRTGAINVSVPPGRGYYHLNISLEDNKTQKPVTDAEVTMQVSDGLMHEVKKLTRLAANNSVSYGNFFKFSSGNAYHITAEIKRPGVAGPIVAKFEFKAP